MIITKQLKILLAIYNHNDISKFFKNRNKIRLGEAQRALTFVGGAILAASGTSKIFREAVVILLGTLDYGQSRQGKSDDWFKPAVRGALYALATLQLLQGKNLIQRILPLAIAATCSVRSYLLLADSPTNMAGIKTKLKPWAPYIGITEPNQILFKDLFNTAHFAFAGLVFSLGAARVSPRWGSIGCAVVGGLIDIIDSGRTSGRAYSNWEVNRKKTAAKVASIVGAILSLGYGKTALERVVPSLFPILGAAYSWYRLGRL